jgi:hypothetical protein
VFGVITRLVGHEKQAVVMDITQTGINIWRKLGFRIVQVKRKNQTQDLPKPLKGLLKL